MLAIDDREPQRFLGPRRASHRAMRHIDIVKVLFGILFIVVAFVANTFGYGFGRRSRPHYPITLAGRVLVFCLGLALIIIGIVGRHS